MQQKPPSVSCHCTVAKAEPLMLCACSIIAEIDDLKDVLEAVNDVASNWDNLGMVLKIKDSELGIIKADHKDSVRDCLKEVVSLWLKGNGGERSWKFLCNALKNSPVNECAIAEKIEQKH